MNLYFDNAATSWPKPPEVAKAIADCIEHLQGNPLRSSGGHGSKLIFSTREMAAKLFHIPDSSRVIFTPSATIGINLCIQGYLKDGHRVVTTSVEHNAVARLLNMMKQDRRFDLEIVPCSTEGYLDPDDLRKALAVRTDLVVMNHASNATGAYQNLETMGVIVKESGAVFMIDASQSAGSVDIDVERDCIDIFCCPGHKGLLGPTGTAICYIAPNIKIRPLIYGGTGSESEKDVMPDATPDRFEAGTLNSHGLAGLNKSVEYILERGLKDIFNQKMMLVQLTLDELRKVDGLKIHGPRSPRNRMPVFSVTAEGIDSAELATHLYEEHRIITRVGLHCAPWAHKTMGTFPQGTLRLSPGLFHTQPEILFMIEKLASSIQKLRSHG